MGQVPTLAASVDIVLVTTRYNKTIDKPVISVFGLISGINEEQTAKDIVEACRRVLASEPE